MPRHRHREARRPRGPERVRRGRRAPPPGGGTALPGPREPDRPRGRRRRAPSRTSPVPIRRGPAPPRPAGAVAAWRPARARRPRGSTPSTGPDPTGVRAAGAPRARRGAEGVPARVDL